MFEHKVFKRILSDGNVLIFVPSLNFVSIVKEGDMVPDFIESEKPIPQKIINAQNDFYPTGVTILTTNKCNLQCCYCYGSFRPGNFSFLPINLGKKIVDFLIQNAIKIGRKSIRMSYFGGEPTQYWEFLEEINDYAKKMTERYNILFGNSISTNGCITKQQADWLINNIKDIQISIDGFKTIQDRHRDNSFDRCYEIAKYFYSKQKYFNIRATVSSVSVNVLENIVDFFVSEFPKSKIAFEPLSPCGRLSDPEIKDPNIDLFFKKLEKLYCTNNANIKSTLCQFSNSYNENFCGVDQPNFFVTPDGEIVACSRIDNDRVINPFQYGYINNLGQIIIDREKMEFIRAIHVNNIVGCNNCFAKSTCKGGCPSQKLFLFGDGFSQKTLPTEVCKNICDLTEKRLLSKLNYKLSQL